MYSYQCPRCGNVGFEVLMPVVMKNSIFLDKKPLTFNGLHNVKSQKTEIFIQDFSSVKFAYSVYDIPPNMF
jgi:hypothetical protein